MTFEELMQKVESVDRLELFKHDFGKTYLREAFLVLGDEVDSTAFGWIAKHTSIEGEETGFVAIYQRRVGCDFEDFIIDITPEQLFALRGALFSKCE